jgi:hypothetical protein
MSSRWRDSLPRETEGLLRGLPRARDSSEFTGARHVRRSLLRGLPREAKPFTRGIESLWKDTGIRGLPA